MELDKYLIGFVVFSIAVLSSVTFIGSINENYDVDIDSSNFNSTFDKIDEMYNLTKDMEDSTLNNEIGSGEESWDSMTKGSYSTIRLIKNSFSVVNAIFNDISKVLNVQPFIIKGVTIILIISIVLTIVYMIFHFQPR